MIKYLRQVYLYYFFAFLPFLVYTLVYFYLNNYFTELVHVDTAYGRLQGFAQTSRDGRRFYQFNSVPYAKPPVGPLRFQPPAPLESWEGVKDATQMTANCLQYDLVFKSFRGQEDCLLLNIYTPQDPTKPTKKLLPVLVFIHGGIFMLGGSGELYSGRYLMDEDVIFVTVNYRLGILGFLNTGDDVVSGNMGLKDQLEALKFVKRTIRDFGGDPNLITLWGESAGSVSVHLHMLSPQSKGLFQRAISQSGSSFSPWAFTRNPREQAVHLGNQLGCPTNNSEQLVECLSSIDPWELIQPQEKLLDIFIDPQDMFGPSVENVTAPELKATAFLTEYPYKLAAEGRTHPVPWISGVNSHEGCYRSAWLVGAPQLLNRLSTDWDSVASSTFLLFRNDSQTFRKVRTAYFGEGKEEITIADYEPLTNLIGDRFFSIPARDAALLHAKLSGAPTYLYYFEEKVDDSIGHFLSTLSDESWMPRWLQMAADVARRRIYEFLNWEIQDFGTCHADEMLMFVTVVPTLTLMDIRPGDRHYEFSKKLIKVWTSFARNGKPDEFDSVKWERVNFNGNSTIKSKASSTSSIPKYLHINSQRPEMIDEPFYSRLNFWHEIKLPRNLSPDQEHIYSHDIMEHKLMNTCANATQHGGVLTHVQNKTTQI